MTDFKTDEEKAEDIKAWWKENGTSVVVGVALAIGGLFGWDYYKGWKLEQAEQASALYSQAQTSDKQQVELGVLQKDYANTPYAAIASLEQAKISAQSGDYDAATNTLQWVIDNSAEDYFKDVARLRMARVLLAQDKTDAAMTIADSTFPAAYESLVAELKGDIYTAKQDKTAAQQAYQRAILTNSDGSNEFIQMKLDNLGEEAS